MMFTRMRYTPMARMRRPFSLCVVLLLLAVASGMLVGPQFPFRSAVAAQANIGLSAPPRMRVFQSIVQPTSGEVAIGENITFKITVWNVGLLPIGYLWVKDQYPVDCLRYVSSEPAAWDDREGLVSWAGVKLGPHGLLPNESVSVTITFRAIASFPNMVNLGLASGWTVDNQRVPSAYDEMPIDVVSRNLYCQRSWGQDAPVGMPDFDQKQAGWKSPASGAWSYSGPVAVANALWWQSAALQELDRASAEAILANLDPAQVPQLVARLAELMDTDGQRTGAARSGTDIMDVESAITSLLDAEGLADKYEISVQSAPGVGEVLESVRGCEGVILLLGFWQKQAGTWKRLGGHYVTVSCVSRAGEPSALMDVSDPYFDRAEAGWLGEYTPGLPHGHDGPDAWAVHNNPGYVSWDLYSAEPVAVPQGTWGLQGYAPSWPELANMAGQNSTSSLVRYATQQASTGPVVTSVEFALRIAYVGDPPLCPRPTVTPGPTPTATPEYGPPETVELQQGLNGYAGVRDTYINAWYPQTNYARSGELNVRSDGLARALLRFDLANVPADALIMDAQLELYAMSGGWYEQDVSIYPVRLAWHDAEATWKSATQQALWNEAGCSADGDRDAAAVGTQLAVAGTALDYNITDLVRRWVADPSSNFGVLLQGSYGISVQHGLASSDHWYAAKRPKLVLTFARRQ